MATVARSLRKLLAVRDSGELAALCRRHDLELVVLFGSAVSGSQVTRDPGNIELAIAARGRRQANLHDVIEDLTELVGGDHLDVMDLALSSSADAHRALARGERLYEAEPHLFAERQIVAINQHIDDEYWRRTVLPRLTR